VLAAIYAIAFASLLAQLDLLFGARGLAPLANVVDTHRTHPELGFFDLPSVLWLGASDGALAAWAWIGYAIAMTWLCGAAPRVCAAICAAIYLSFAGPGQPFLSFQWDNLLVEAGFLAAFLPVDRPARWIHALLLLLAIKLYFESGLAKLAWGGDQWPSGEAMEYYYETAPIPGPFAFAAHHAPPWWHLFESRAVVAIELGAAWLFAARARWVRVTAVAVLTMFQLINVATANYGFFVPLALALHLFALRDDELAWVQRQTVGRLRRSQSEPRVRSPAAGAGATAIAVAVSTYWIVCSYVVGKSRFVDDPSWHEAAAVVAPLHEPFRTANAYHLFGPITTQRNEVELETLADGVATVLRFRFKPGPLERVGTFPQPHQPRVDFQLWFYGLQWRRGTPRWVRTLLDRVCDDPELVRDLFDEPLPRRREAVRLRLWRYRFASPEQRAKTGEAWTRTPVVEIAQRRCPR
jgi:hypothetical protein